MALPGTTLVILLVISMILVAGLSLVAFAADKPSPGPAAPFAAPRYDAWRVIGPGGGGAQFHPAINPHDPSKILLNSDMTDCFISDNGGDSWRMVNLRGPASFFVWDPVDKDVAYAQTIGLWRTADGGRTWSLVYPDPAEVTGVGYSGDHGQDFFKTPGGAKKGSVGALAVDPSDSKKLYATMGDKGAALYSSADWGKTWTKMTDLPGGCRKILVDPKSPKGNRTLYLLGATSVRVIENGKRSERAGPKGATFHDVSAAFPASGGQPVIYGVSGRGWRTAGGAAGAFVSTDGGASWSNCVPAIAKLLDEEESVLQFQAVAACAGEPGVAYVSFKVPKHNPADPIQSSRLIGVVKTTDAGKTWTAVWRDVDDKPSENVKDAWLNERFGPWWGENPFNLDVAAGDPDICVGTDFGRTMRTTDGGKTWQGVYSRAMADGSWSTTGLDVSCCYSVHFDPFDMNRMFITYTDIGLFRSENGGSGWLSATTSGVPKRWLNATYWVEFDPQVKGLVWAVMSGVHDLPRPKMWRGRGSVGQSGGVLESTDGGVTWNSISDSVGEFTPTHILMDPKSPAGQRTLYVCGFGKGVLKSTDNGHTWALRNNGIDGADPLCWRMTRAGDGALYLVVFRRTEDGSIGNTGDGALYRSTDGAESWTKIALPKGVNGPADIAVDPKDPKKLCLAAWGRLNESGDTGGGVFVSTDGGKAWKDTLSKDQHIHDVTIDSRNGAYYACGFESNAWRSADSGMAWGRIKGYNFKWGRKVIPDPLDPSMIYVTTFGGSVWYGPAAGDPKAVEDIVTPQVAY